MAAPKIEVSEKCAGQQVPKQVVPLRKHPGRSSGNADDYAAYAFDMLQSLREASTREKHAFLRYLMGMAAEEAYRLAEGQASAAAAYGRAPK